MNKNITKKMAFGLLFVSSVLSASSVISVGFEKPDALEDYSYEEINTINMNNSLYLKADMQNIMSFANNTRAQVESLKIEIAELKKENKRLTEYTNDLKRKVASNTVNLTDLKTQRLKEQEVRTIKSSFPKESSIYDKKIKELSAQMKELKKELASQKVKLQKQNSNKVTIVKQEVKNNNTVKVNSHILGLVK